MESIPFEVTDFGEFILINGSTQVYPEIKCIIQKNYNGLPSSPIGSFNLSVQKENGERVTIIPPVETNGLHTGASLPTVLKINTLLPASWIYDFQFNCSITNGVGTRAFGIIGSSQKFCIEIKDKSLYPMTSSFLIDKEYIHHVHGMGNKTNHQASGEIQYISYESYYKLKNATQINI